MSLYLCVLDPENEEEYEAVEVGPYSYFGAVRDAIKSAFGGELKAIKIFPQFLLHQDCFGEWTVENAHDLKKEIIEIKSELTQLKPRMLIYSEWYIQYYRKINPNCFYDCFIDIEGQNLFDNIFKLCEVSIQSGLPILFQ